MLSHIKRCSETRRGLQNDMKTIVLAAAISTLPTTLHAQESSKSDSDQAEDIVVTATAVAKLDVPLAETPQNITVITQEAFERQNATSVEEICATCPRCRPSFRGDRASMPSSCAGSISPATSSAMACGSIRGFSSSRSRAGLLRSRW